MFAPPRGWGDSPPIGLAESVSYLWLTRFWPNIKALTAEPWARPQCLLASQFYCDARLVLWAAPRAQGGSFVVSIRVGTR